MVPLSDELTSVRMLDHALRYAARGWAVLPLAGKTPHNRRGVTDATTDVEIITSWWTRWPDANIGARVPQSCVVLDVDPRNGGSIDMLFAGFEPTLTLTALSGRRDRGAHLYYRRPEMPLSAARLPTGVDLKINGYMVMPPSVHPDTGLRYGWYDHEVVSLPEHLLALLRVPLRVVRDPRHAPSCRDVVARLDRLLAVLRSAVEGQRNDRLHWVACRVGEMLANGDLPDAVKAAEALTTVALDTGLGHGEIGRAIASGFSKSGVRT